MVGVPNLGVDRARNAPFFDLQTTKQRQKGGTKKKKEKKGKGKKCDERVILKEVANGTGKIRKIARKN